MRHIELMRQIFVPCVSQNDVAILYFLPSYVFYDLICNDDLIPNVIVDLPAQFILRLSPK
jgi:hypothetical protein